MLTVEKFDILERAEKKKTSLIFPPKSSYFYILVYLLPVLFYASIFTELW